MIKKPPLGISLARTFGGDICETRVKQAADAMVSLGLRDAGYEYLLIGDALFAPRRDRATGALLVNGEKFPSGIKALTDYVHGLGLKLGITTSAGAATASGAPGCLDHEYDDVVTFADWGIDMISHDCVNIPLRANEQTLLRRMGMAIRAVGGNILYSAFSTDEKLHVWIRSAGANAYCDRVIANAAGVTPPPAVTYGYSADYCWHNCGEIVLNKDTSVSALRSQLILAAMMSSPIIVDCDVASLSESDVAPLKCKSVLTVSQDEDGRPARIYSDGVYVKYLENAEYAVAFINQTDEEKKLDFYAHDFGITWNAGYALEFKGICGTDATTEFDAMTSVTVPANDAVLYKLSLV